MKILFFKIIFFTIFFTNNLVYSKDSARLSIGGGIFNYMEDGTPPHNDQSQMLKS